MGDDLTVAAAADALGTSPQTVRSLLRKGELRGRKREWGNRYVWDVSREGVDEFLAAYGRLDGHRRAPRPAAPTSILPFPTDPDPAFADEKPVRQRPLVLRPRGRATVVVFVLGVPIVVAYLAARVLPGAWWFDELDQQDTFSRIVAAKLELATLATLVVALVVGANLTMALRPSRVTRTPAGVLGVAVVALVTGSMFASSATGHWQAYLLWRHRQPFGSVDPIHGQDVGFFVFTLPLELVVAEALLWLLVVTTGYVVIVGTVQGTLRARPLRATVGMQMHLAVLAAAFLVLLAWRLRLEQYRLETDQPSARAGDSFSGAGYVDVHVRSPAITVLIVLCAVLAVACLLAPVLARAGRSRGARLCLVIPGTALALATVVGGAVIPALVQRYTVDPSPLLTEQPYLARSISATRAGLGLDAVDVQPYTPTGTFTAADFRPVSERLDDVSIWDASLLGTRMSQLVTDAPYFNPQDPVLDVDRVDGRRRPTVVSTRDLDLRQAPEKAGAWINDRLAYTHGLGLVRYSATDTTQGRAPRLLDRGLGVREPRIYFGNFSRDQQWALADTRRPEVDVPTSDDAPAAPYHYDGSGGIELSTWIRRVVFAADLGSKQLLLSDDVTPQSRLLLHRDVHDRLHTLAPFIQWDTSAVPLTDDGHIVFVVDGYTTSANYPYAERFDLGGSRVNYARASVRATVDAFTGEVDLYLADDVDPVAGAWAEAFPDLFRPADEMPAELRDRLRYPADLFATQASAYEQYHTTRPDVFASDADAWSRPIALSGPVEVAGGVDFDESDEDDLRLTLQPAYTFAPPPGHTAPQLVLGTLYTPDDGQNLVATLSGWIDSQGRARLASRSLSRDRTNLGPAQISRLVFATPRVSNLLGIRNLETTDLDTSSIDDVLLGRPQVLFSPSGMIQIQSLYEGSRGPGAARLLGVTAFLNGRAGLGPDIRSAVRQALNDPPTVALLHPGAPVVVGRRVDLTFDVANARRETVTVTSSAGSERTTRRVASGRGTVPWVPSAAGTSRVRIEVVGLDGTRMVRSMAVRVLSPPPKIRIVRAPDQAAAGRTVRVTFRVADAVRASATVSTRSGVVFARDYLIRDGRGVLKWTPETPGTVVIVVRAHGHQGQTAIRRLRLEVAPAPAVVLPPVVTILQVPAAPTVGQQSTIVFRADGCRVTAARIKGPEGDTRSWRFPCPAPRATFVWTPSAPGPYVLTAVARGDDGQTTNQIVRLTVPDDRATGPSPSPSVARSLRAEPDRP